jgi:hypothetical protein
MRSVLPALLVLALSAAAAPTSYIRFEQPSESTFGASVRWSILSGKQAIALHPVPGKPTPNEADARYDIEVPDGGEYTFWLRTYDPKWSSPAKWRFNDGEWQDLKPLEVTGTAVESGVFRMDWLRLGTVALTKGAHTLSVHVAGKRPQNDYPFFVIDVGLLVRGDGYTPKGIGDPAQDVREQIERAREQVRKSGLADTTKLLTHLDEIQRGCLADRLSRLQELAPLQQEIALALAREDLVRPPLIPPLHGTVTEVKIKDAQLRIATRWSQPLAGRVWVGLVQEGALYAGRTGDLSGDGTIALPLPNGLPAGPLACHVVPLGQVLRKAAIGTLVVPPELAAAAPVPSAWGIYRDGVGVCHPWQVTSGGMMLWDGEPYIPIGGMVNSAITWQSRAGESDDTPLVRNALALADRQFRLLREKGLQDIYFNGCFTRLNPNAFNRLLALAEQHGLRYGIHVSSRPEITSLGFVRKDSYALELAKGTSETMVSVEIPAGDKRARQRCLWAVVNADGTVTDAGTGTMVTGPATADGKVTLRLPVHLAEPAPAGARLVFLPELPMPRSEPSGYYAGIDQYIAQVHDTYGQLKLGPGLRLWIDPFQNEMHGRFTSVCTEPAFQTGYADHLLGLYGDLARLHASWLPVADVDRVASFGEAARLIPLHHGPQAYAMIDPTTGAVHRFQATGTACGRDLAVFRGQVGERFVSRMADELKRIADVPVILKHNVWFSTWFVNPRKAGGLDGVGYEAYCYGDSLTYHNSLVAYAEALNSARHQWSLVTETSPAAFDGQKDYVGYLDRLQMLDSMDLLFYYGAKGFYEFGFVFLPGPFQITTLLRDPRQLEWLHSHGEILRAAAPRLRTYRPEVYGWYPTYLQDETIVGGHPPEFAMDAHYTGVPTQIRQAPDQRWIVPAVRPDAPWQRLLAAMPLLTARDRARLPDSALRLGTADGPPLDGFTACGIGVIDPAKRAPTLDDFRRDVLGYRVFQTRDTNGHTLPDGSLRIWTCVEREQAELRLPAGCVVRNLQGDEVPTTGAADGTVVVRLVRPPYTKETKDRPTYLTYGYYYPDRGQPEMVLVKGAAVDAVLALNPPARDRWLPAAVSPDNVLAWHEAEDYRSTTFTQPRLEGFSRYSGGAAIGINTHFAPPDDQPFVAEYTIETAQAAPNAALWIRRLEFPVSTFRLELDGKVVGTIDGKTPMSDLLHLSPWSAAIGTNNLRVGWCRTAVGPLAAGRHTLRILVDPHSLRQQIEVDTKLMGGDAEKRIGALKHGRSLRCLQLDAILLAR